MDGGSPQLIINGLDTNNPSPRVWLRRTSPGGQDKLGWLDGLQGTEDCSGYRELIECEGIRLGRSKDQVVSLD